MFGHSKLLAILAIHKDPSTKILLNIDFFGMMTQRVVMLHSERKLVKWYLSDRLRLGQVEIDAIHMYNDSR